MDDRLHTVDDAGYWDWDRKDCPLQPGLHEAQPKD